MKINCLQNQQIFLGIVVYNMFKEKENYYFVEEFEKYDINAIYTKKIMGNYGKERRIIGKISE